MNGSLTGFEGTGTQRAALEQVALAATAAEVGEQAGEMLVIALWPEQERRKVIASPGNSAIRAAISVAVAAGNTRAWSDSDDGAPTDLPVTALPEIIRASVEPSGIRTVQVATVRHGDEVICSTMWLSPSDRPAPTVHDRHAVIVRQLRAGADADLARAEEAARQEAAALAARAAEAGDRTGARTMTSGVQGLPDQDHLCRMLDELECEQAAVLVVGVDDAEAISEQHGVDTAAAACDVVADRLVGSLRKHDLVAHLGDATFAVVLVNVDRHTAFDVSRRLRDAVSEPMPAGDWPTVLSISVGLAHEDGLFDAEELLEAATGAMHDARSEGGARMLIAC